VAVALEGRAAQNVGFPFNIFATAEASDFKFGIQLGFAKAHHKITPGGKWVWPWARGAPKNFGIPFNFFATERAQKLGLPTCR